MFFDPVCSYYDAFLVNGCQRKKSTKEGCTLLYESYTSIIKLHVVPPVSDFEQHP
jgi:hypothetical protein